MNFIFQYRRSLIAIAATIFATLAIAANVLSLWSASNVTQSATRSSQASTVRLAFQEGANFKKTWLVSYAEQDAATQQDNIFIKYSHDEGRTWSAAVLLSKDAAGQATGGQTITTRLLTQHRANNTQPTISAMPGSSPHIMVTWTSSYCPQNPATPQAGSYISATQGASAATAGGAGGQAFYCVWTANTTAPNLNLWTSTQLTNASRHATHIVAANNPADGGVALAWQEDSGGLQLTNGTTGAGSNIWYTHAPAGNSASLRNNLLQASSNNATTPADAPAAAQPQLAVQGGTAVLVYEQSGCQSGTSNHCIVYHGFPYAQPGDAGTVISNPAQHARAPQLALQADHAPTAALRSAVLWRESAANAQDNAPADIVLRRGLAGASAVGSSGLRAADLLQDPPRNITAAANAGINTQAHSAFISNKLVALAYTQSNAALSTNYTLFITRSLNGGASWNSAQNLSGLNTALESVSTFRLAATPPTVSNPLTGRSDLGDTQNTYAFFVGYTAQSSPSPGAPRQLFISRTKDQGASFEPFLAVSGKADASSGIGIAPLPDGESAGIVWQEPQTSSNPQSTDALFTTAAPVLSSSAEAGNVACGCGTTTGKPQDTDPALPLLAGLSLLALHIRRKHRL